MGLLLGVRYVALLSATGCLGHLYSYNGSVADLDTLFPLNTTTSPTFQCPSDPCRPGSTLLLRVPLPEGPLNIRAIGGAANVGYAQRNFSYSSEQYQPFLWLDHNGQPGQLLTGGPALNVTASRWTAFPLNYSSSVNGSVWAGLRYVAGLYGPLFPLLPSAGAAPGSWYLNSTTAPPTSSPQVAHFADAPFAMYVDAVTWTPTLTGTRTLTRTATLTPTGSRTTTSSRTTTRTQSVSATGTMTLTITSTATRRRLFVEPTLSINKPDPVREARYGVLPVFPDPITAAMRATIAGNITARGGEKYTYGDGAVTYFDPHDGRNWDVSWNGAGLTVLDAGSGVQRVMAECYDPVQYPSYQHFAASASLFLCVFDRATATGQDMNGVPLTLGFTDPGSNQSGTLEAFSYSDPLGSYIVSTCSAVSTQASCSVAHTSMVAISRSAQPSTSGGDPAPFPYITLLALLALVPLLLLLALWCWRRRPQAADPLRALTYATPEGGSLEGSGPPLTPDPFASLASCPPYPLGQPQPLPYPTY